MGTVKRHVLTGLVLLLPLAITVWIVTFVLDWLTDPFVWIAHSLLDAFSFGALFGNGALRYWTAQALVLLMLLLSIFAIGSLGHYVVLRYVLRFTDSCIRRIPLISSVYTTTQELTQTILSADSSAFKRVVLVPFPHEHAWSFGLVTRESAPEVDQLPVFIPTTPNPTSGYLVLYERTQLIAVDLSVEEAFRYIISIGALPTPEACLKRIVEKQ